MEVLQASSLPFIGIIYVKQQMCLLRNSTVSFFLSLVCRIKRHTFFFFFPIVILENLSVTILTVSVTTVTAVHEAIVQFKSLNAKRIGHYHKPRVTLITAQKTKSAGYCASSPCAMTSSGLFALLVEIGATTACCNLRFL